MQHQEAIGAERQGLRWRQAQYLVALHFNYTVVSRDRGQPDLNLSPLPPDHATTVFENFEQVVGKQPRASAAMPFPHEALPHRAQELQDHRIQA
jgi:hypothetical protein